VTKYKILSKDGSGLWLEHATAVEAGSPDAAIRKHLDGDVDQGTFVAVPLRSFHPVVVTVETKRTVRFGEELPI